MEAGTEEARENAWHSIAAELRRARDHWKREHEQASQGIEHSQLVDVMGENLGLPKSERFLYDRHTKAIRADIKRNDAIKALLERMKVQTPPKSLSRDELLAKVEEMFRIFGLVGNG